MKNYKIAYINHKEYSVIIFSEAYKHPLSNLCDIEEELKNKKVKNGKILFDMILCRGNTEGRYIECLFNGERIVKNTMNLVKIDKKNFIRKLSNQFLRENKESVEYSLLTSIQKRMILKGIAI